MDEAFHPLHRIVEDMAPVGAGFRDEALGVHTYVTRLTVESPLELDITRDGAGALTIASTPPLYRVETTSLPSFHQLRFTVESDGS
jgi:hypothetical protein